MIFELWNVGSGNRIAGFEILDDALDTVREIAEFDGEDAVEELLLEVWSPGADEPETWYDGPRLRRIVGRTRTLSIVASSSTPRWTSKADSPTRRVRWGELVSA
jgi:hypothetical protein